MIGTIGHVRCQTDDTLSIFKLNYALTCTFSEINIFNLYYVKSLILLRFSVIIS